MTTMATGLEPCDRFEWERVVRRLGLPMRLKLVALTLATYADKDGSRVRPGVNALAAVTGQGESTVRRLLAALRESGLIEQVSRGGGRAGHGKATEYRLTLPADVDGLVLLPPSEVSPLPMASGQSDAAPLPRESAETNAEPLAQESAQSELSPVDHPETPLAIESGDCGQSPVDNTVSALAQESGETEKREPIDRSENTVSNGLTARYDGLTARSSERLPDQEHQPPKSDQPCSPDPTQPQTAREPDPNPIELRPRNCAHGLPAHRDATGNPTCPLCRRGLPATEEP